MRARHGGRRLDVVVPISYSVAGEQLHHVLLYYKRGPKPVAAELGMQLAAVLWRFLAEHERCVARTLGVRRPARDDGAVERPCTRRGAPAASARAGHRQTNPGRFRRLLRRTDRPAPAHVFCEERYVATAPLDGEPVLLIDDTWTTGANAQSAAAALRLAGSGPIAAVVIGRHLNRHWGVNARRLERIADALRLELLRALPAVRRGLRTKPAAHRPRMAIYVVINGSRVGLRPRFDRTGEREGDGFATNRCAGCSRPDGRRGRRVRRLLRQWTGHVELDGVPRAVGVVREGSRQLLGCVARRLQRSTSTSSPTSSDQQRQTLVQRLAAGDSSIDILAMDVDWTAEFAHAELDPAMDRRQSRGRLQGRPPRPAQDRHLPGQAVGGADQRQHRAARGTARTSCKTPPKTWDQMIDDAEHARKGGQASLHRGAGRQVRRPHGLVQLARDRQAVASSGPTTT